MAAKQSSDDFVDASISLPKHDPTGIGEPESLEPPHSPQFIAVQQTDVLNGESELHQHEPPQELMCECSASKHGPTESGSLEPPQSITVQHTDALNGESELHQHEPPQQSMGEYSAIEVLEEPTINESFVTRLAPHQHGHTIDVSCLLEDLSVKREACLENGDKEVSKLKMKLSALDKKIMLDESQLLAEKEVINYSIEESNLRKDVFIKYCNEIEAKLDELNEDTQSVDISEQIDSLRASFDRECNRFDKALPIYAHRLDIMKTIASRQVCIVIGETGSGKSTQLVQYLYEAGYASNGLIACTQPRKLAAMSLAEHVSKEVNEVVGATYGYVALKSKQSEKTKVVYMTDHTFLNQCIADPNLSQYSCLVIDEAHERSIHTDILIAFIKRCLPNRPDLKVVITSATINPALFSDYFGGIYDCPVIEVPGRTYPVEVRWEVSPVIMLDRDYVKEAVTKVCDIHVTKRNEPGDILVFLTSPAEIEKACRIAQEALKNEAVVLPLHGKLQPEDQQKVFNDVKGKRKVVFSTNVAETSVTIPGIVYVIDTGLSKELCHDPQKNMNSLEIRPISKSSADQRKGRAGRTCPGECYRLYSQSDYNDMRNDSTPEILRITLASAVIKLYEFGIEDIHTFEFVESPDRKALNEAIENLKFLGAIKEGKLTKLGEKMTFLPLEPNLSKVLFDAIDKEIAIEAAAAVAISTLAGRIFFRPDSAESQNESDKKRLEFLHESGDQMTNLHAYFEWSCQEKSSQNKWCVSNYVNAKSMKMVQQMVDEFRFILEQKCIFNIPNKIISLDKAYQLLPKLFFDAFIQNICVYLGHDKIGYWSPKHPNEELIIHYGSSLRSIGSVPQCVIYEKTQKTSQHFLLQVLPVREEWIQEAVQSGKLLCHPAEDELFKLRQVKCLSFTNLGLTVATKLQRKFPWNRKISVPEFSDIDVQPAFEHLKAQGTLHVFAQEANHVPIHKLVCETIESFKKELRDETHECGILYYNDEAKIVLGQGGCIQPGDSRTIMVRGLTEELVSDAEEELRRYGKFSCKTKTYQREIRLIATFQNQADSESALNHHFYDRNVKILNYRENRNHFRLDVQWQRRRRRNFAFIDFKNEKFFNSQIRPNFHPTHSFPLKFQTSKNGHCSLMVYGVQPHTTEDVVRSLLLHCLPITEGEDILIRFVYEKQFPETEKSYECQRERLDASLVRFAPTTKYYVDFFNPQEKNVMYKAFIYFDDSIMCEEVQDRLKDIFDSVKLSLSSSIRYPVQVFSVIKPSIEEVSHQVPKTVKIHFNTDKRGKEFLNITACDIGAFTEVKEMLAKVVEPDILPIANYKESAYMSTAHFQRSIKEVQAKTTTFIKINLSSLTTNTITVYGTRERREMAKLHIKTVIQSANNCFEINLTERSPGSMKHLIEKYGPGAARLAEVIEGVTATRLITRTQMLTLFATEDGYQSFLSSLDSYKPTQQAQAADEISLNVSNECCMCFERQDPKSRNFYILEYCGHVYCKECIKQQLNPSSIVFPVTCTAENCDKQLVWKDFETLFKIKFIELQDITSASLKYYAAANLDKVHNCITPDCKMVYAISNKAKLFLCKHCGANICTRCHTTWHEGKDTCEVDQICSTHTSDVGLQDLMRRDLNNRIKNDTSGASQASRPSPFRTQKAHKTMGAPMACDFDTNIMTSIIIAIFLIIIASYLFSSLVL